MREVALNLSSLHRPTHTSTVTQRLGTLGMDKKHVKRALCRAIITRGQCVFVSVVMLFVAWLFFFLALFFFFDYASAPPRGKPSLIPCCIRMACVWDAREKDGGCTTPTSHYWLRRLLLLLLLTMIAIAR